MESNKLTGLVGQIPTGADNTSALRYDEGKLRVDLIPPQWIEWLAEVFTVGAKKYAEHNWKKGMKFSRMQGSMVRHLLRWQRGENVDSESGLNPLLHVAWNALALAYYQDEGLIEWDDREFKETGLLTAEDIINASEFIPVKSGQDTLGQVCMYCRSNPCICSKILSPENTCE